jgi:hypothetical protein
MANLHETFIEFNESIKLSSLKKDKLRISRNAVRRDIEKYFEVNQDKHSVKFKGQGSFSMNTTILPISGEYDVDDGVYIFGKEEDRPTPQTAHNWIFKAVENRTNQDTIDKNACVRVQYAGDYHIDLPIYYKTTDNESEFFFDSKDIPELAHKNKGWIQSDPYAFKKWFDEQSKDKSQLKRIVRFLKAWTDNKHNHNLPSGMVFTILASENYTEKERDDEAMLSTLKKIQESIDDTRNWSASYVCKRPTTDKTENLLDKYSSVTTKKNFLDALDSFIKSGDQALEIKSKKDACAKWQKHLGDRFPCSSILERDEDIAKAFVAPDLIRTDNKSA